MSDHNYIQTSTGRKIYLDNFKNNDYYIGDIAHSLSNKCRFNGHSKFFYSVAQHCVLASGLIKDKSKALETLLHDSGEYVMPDMPRPIKNYFKNIEEFEYNITADIFTRYGLNWPLDKDIVEVDDRLLATEARQIMNKCNIDEWPVIGKLEPYNIVLDSWRPEHAKQMFLDRFNFLFGKRVDSNELLIEEELDKAVNE